MRLDGIVPGSDFNQALKLYRRLEELKDAHTTGLVLTEAQAPVLDIASRVGLCAMIEIKIEPDEVLEPKRRRAVESRIRKTVAALAGHPALLGYLLDCPISQDALKEHGLERVRRYFRALIRAARRLDEHSLVAFKHRPWTRAIALLEEDLIYGLMPAVTPLELRRYVLSLHNMAEARPLVIEFAQAGPGQDELVECAFGLGAAGVVAPPTRAAALGPQWLRIGPLTGREMLPFVTLNGSCPPPVPRTPMVSVVICAYNAERTMRECLVSLRALAYPNYEVVIVDDGSRDRTAEIAKDFPEFRLIRQANKGLSVARNVGLHAARGDIIAYTDSDCVVDPHWLTFLVRAMVENGFEGCGGPNYAPHEEGRIEACVAASPGAPCHVLTGEDRAEHLAGCNMAFAKAALLAVGGFDPQFTSAGDDVDICWRTLQAGYTLGFCPAAFVWHFRRNTVKAYYGQQRGYGRAEAMLYFKYPERFNALGQIRWRGTIPGLARTVPGGGRRGVIWRRAKDRLQPVSEPGLGIAAFLPQTLEWNLLSALALATSFALGWPVIPALAMLALGPLWSLYYAWRAPLEKCHEGLISRLFVAVLAYTGPMARTVARHRLRLGPPRGNPSVDAAPRQKPRIHWLARSVHLHYWNEGCVTRDTLLDKVMKLFAGLGHPTLIDSGWKDFDLEVRPDPWTRVQVKTADEEHERGQLKNLVVARIRLSGVSRLVLIAGGTGAVAGSVLGLPSLALELTALTVAGAIFVLSEVIESGRLAYRTIEQCAQDLALIPLGKLSTSAARRTAGLQAALAPVPGNQLAPSSPPTE